MTAHRSRKIELKYHAYRRALPRPDYCQFCEVGPDHQQYICQTTHFKIIRNIFAYTIWDGAGVRDHLLILPLQHTDTLAGLSKAASQEFIQ